MGGYYVRLTDCHLECVSFLCGFFVICFFFGKINGLFYVSPSKFSAHAGVRDLIGLPFL